MATYSTFFSSGLLAPRIGRCTTPVLPSSPVAFPTSPVDPVDRQSSLTPTPVGQTSPCPKALEAHTNAERPTMRRRRSSFNIGVSPMALIKSPIRNAGAALQRTGFLSPTRHRAGSVSTNEAFENNSLLGRLRSGSVGRFANPPKRMRRAIALPVPLAPPPSVPLPELPPSSPSPKCGGSFFPPVVLGSVPGQPLTARSACAEDAGNHFSALPSLLNPDYSAKMPFKTSPGPSGSCDGTIDEAMMEN